MTLDQQKNINKYREMLEKRGEMLPEEIEEKVREKIAEIEALNRL